MLLRGEGASHEAFLHGNLIGQFKRTSHEYYLLDPSLPRPTRAQLSHGLQGRDRSSSIDYIWRD